MRNKDIRKEIQRYGELWDREYKKREKNICLEYLDIGFKFAFRIVRDIIRHNEELEELLDFKEEKTIGITEGVKDDKDLSN